MSERKGQTIQRKKRTTIQCPKEKDKQSERKGQSIQCLKEKDKQYNV